MIAGNIKYLSLMYGGFFEKIYGGLKKNMIFEKYIPLQGGIDNFRRIIISLIIV